MTVNPLGKEQQTVTKINARTQDRSKQAPHWLPGSAKARSDWQLQGRAIRILSGVHPLVVSCLYTLRSTLVCRICWPALLDCSGFEPCIGRALGQHQGESRIFFLLIFCLFLSVFYWQFHRLCLYKRLMQVTIIAFRKRMCWAHFSLASSWSFAGSLGYGLG